MFGHQNEDATDEAIKEQTISGPNPATVVVNLGTSNNAASEPAATSQSSSSVPPVPQSRANEPTLAEIEERNAKTKAAAEVKANEEPESTEAPDSLPKPENRQASVNTLAAATAEDELLDIKQQALSQLTPLVSHLDQSPVEKFRTLMMMIQASDNQSLISQAYEAAQQITDEKEKAQALLDIVNEINYFTHPH